MASPAVQLKEDVDFDSVDCYRDSPTRQLTTLLSQLLVLEGHILPSSFLNSYDHGIGKRWRTLVSRSHRMLLQLSKLSEAAQLASESGIPPVVCLKALQDVADVDPVQWLLENHDQWTAW